MSAVNIQAVIDILEEFVGSAQLDTGKIDEAIEILEDVKSRIDPKDDEGIDKVDEIQDYLEYLLAIGEVSMDERTEELVEIITSLKTWLSWK